MNWYEVWVAILGVIEADAEIQAVLGDAIYLEGSREIELPSMTALLVVNTEEEIEAPAEWQFDIYGATLDQVVRVEKAMMRLLHKEGSTDIGGVEVFSEFVTGRTLNGPAPDRFFRRSLDFRFTPARSRYYQPVIGDS